MWRWRYKPHANEMQKSDSSSMQKSSERTVFSFTGECKDTLATIADPIAHNKFGRNEGAWMKDPMAHDNKIYVANYYYGNKLLEFQNMDVFKQGIISSEYPVSRISQDFLWKALHGQNCMYPFCMKTSS